MYKKTIIFEGEYGEDKIFFVKDTNINKITFLNHFGVNTSSYIGDLFEQLFDHLLKNAINLKDEYDLFYSNEFDTFSDYLQKCFNLNQEDIAIIMSDNNYHYKNLKNSMDNSSPLLSYNDQASLIIKKEFRNYIEGIKHEN